MKFLGKKLMKRITYFAALFYLFMFEAAPSVFASGAPAGTPDMVLNAMELANDALTWVLLLTPPVGGVMLAFQAWMKMMSDDDPGAIAARNKSMKRILVGTIIVFSASGIVKLFVQYFQ